MRSSVGMLDLVGDFEGKVVKNASALQTKVCRYSSSVPKEHRAIPSLIDRRSKTVFTVVGPHSASPWTATWFFVCEPLRVRLTARIRKDVSQPNRANKLREPTFVLRRRVFARAPRERP